MSDERRDDACPRCKSSVPTRMYNQCQSSLGQVPHQWHETPDGVQRLTTGTGNETIRLNADGVPEMSLEEAEQSSALEAMEVLFKALGWKSGGLGSAAIEIVKQRDGLRAEIGKLKSERAPVLAHSFVSMKWACGHEGEAACVQCFRNQSAEIESLKNKLNHHYSRYGLCSNCIR